MLDLDSKYYMLAHNTTVSQCPMWLLLIWATLKIGSGGFWMFQHSQFATKWLKSTWTQWEAAQYEHNYATIEPIAMAHRKKPFAVNCRGPKIFAGDWN